MSERVTDEMVRIGAEAAARRIGCYGGPGSPYMCSDPLSDNCECGKYARAALEAALPLIVAGERRKAFNSLLDAYECWAASDAGDDGKMAVGNTIFLLYPEFRDEARERAAAIRADKGGE